MNVARTTDAAFRVSLDRLLKGICRKLQLTPTQYQLAENHYKAVGAWLEREGSILAPYQPQIYPQGSLPMGVTNKPLDQEEYDLDFICELQISCSEISPAILFSKFEYRIKQHKDYAARMERGKRCIRLTYAHDFHLDIVPACSNAGVGWGQIRIPDREQKNWKDSNPKAYIRWFYRASEQLLVKGQHSDHAEPLPQQEPLEEKSALKCAVQLFKRHRDVSFEAIPDLAPASIVISTLCAEHYQGNESVFVTVADILAGLIRRIDQSSGEHLKVWNPANRVPENLGERWEKNPDAYREFVRWLRAFNQQWQKLASARGYQEIGDILAALFDEQPTRTVIREDAIQLNQHRALGQLGATAGTGVLSVQPTAIKIPRNTFYGR